MTDQQLERLARWTPLFILGYFTAQFLIRVGFSANLEIDESQFVGQTHLALGYGDSHPPLYNWLITGALALTGGYWPAAVALVKNFLLAGTYLLAFDTATPGHRQGANRLDRRRKLPAASADRVEIADYARAFDPCHVRGRRVAACGCLHRGARRAIRTCSCAYSLRRLARAARPAARLGIDPRRRKDALDLEPVLVGGCSPPSWWR